MENNMRNSSTIIKRLDSKLLEIYLNRPEKLNAFNIEMHENLYDCLEIARDDDNVRAIMISGSGRAFCAGQDLGDRHPDKLTEEPDLEKTLTNFYNPLVTLIRAINKPVICAVNGVAAGAGANLALACDIVIANETARFIQSFSKVGLVPDAGGSWLLPRLVGEARAKALTMTACPVTAKQAEEWGLIWKTYPENEFLKEAKKLGVELASGASVGLGLTKENIQSAANQDFKDHLIQEAKSQGICGRTNDYKEGVRAFSQKRAPNFGGN
jgi:2-(1,2-epoxy-1,2-dihydrophenyl)acetyl-CoA isomerase